MEKKLEVNDEKLAKSIAHTLDKSVDELNEVSLQRLKKAREHALSYSPTISRKWNSLRIAASVAVLALIPIAFHQYSQTESLDQDMEIVSQEIPYSAEEMDDIDMLMSLEGDDA